MNGCHNNAEIRMYVCTAGELPIRFFIFLCSDYTFCSLVIYLRAPTSIS